jgi:hypothetical protein
LQKLAGKINQRHTALVTNTRRLISEAVEIGNIIARGRENFEHGKFEGWLEQNVKCSRRNAFNYLSLYDHQNQIIGANNLTVAYKLIETLEARKKQTEAQKASQRVAEYRKTGKKPEGWRQHTDDKLAQEEAERDKRIEEPCKKSAARRKQSRGKRRSRRA